MGMRSQQQQRYQRQVLEGRRMSGFKQAPCRQARREVGDRRELDVWLGVVQRTENDISLLVKQ
jgi:hypothetical protein